MTRRTVAAALTVTLVCGCGPPLQLEDEIAEVEQRLDQLLPDDWEQVDEPVTNGIGCVFDDCVRLSVTYRPTSAISEHCEELRRLLDDARMDPTVRNVDTPRCQAAGAVGRSFGRSGWQVFLFRTPQEDGDVLVRASAELLDPD